MVTRALKLFLWGLILWPILINFIGFISPFWALYILGDGMRSYELLRFFQPVVPLVSIVFAASLLFLAKVDDRTWIKGSCWIVSLVYVGCSIYGLLPEDALISYVLDSINTTLSIIMLFLGGLILLHIFEQAGIHKASG